MRRHKFAPIWSKPVNTSILLMPFLQFYCFLCFLSSSTLFVNKTESFADTNSTFQKWRKWQFGRFCTVLPEHYESLNPSMKGKIDHIEVTKWEKNAKLKQVKNVCLCLISVLMRKWMRIAWISATLSQQLRPLKI